MGVDQRAGAQVPATLKGVIAKTGRMGGDSEKAQGPVTNRSSDCPQQSPSSGF